MEKNIKDVKIEIKVDETVAAGVFSNFANITHSAEEYILDFLFINPTPPPGFGKLVSRIIMTPGHAKRVLHALSNNIKNYEEKFGEIKISSIPEEVKDKLQ